MKSCCTDDGLEAKKSEMKIAKDDKKNIWENTKMSEMADYKLWMTFYVYIESYAVTSLGEIAVHLFLHLRPQ